jgi:hypothetical protein
MAVHAFCTLSGCLATCKPGLALKNPTKKTHPKKPTQKNTKNHLKKPIKNGFFGVFLNFYFFMKIIQTFLFQTDFL